MSVLDRLAEEAPSYHVFQAVRLVQEAEPQAVPIGYQGPVEHEVLRFRAELSLGFPGRARRCRRISPSSCSGASGMA